MKKNIYILSALLLCLACSKQQKPQVLQAADFNADSAYLYVAQQVAFGPRVPATMAHYDCARFLQARLEEFGASVRVEQGQMTDYKGEQQQVYNIIASYNSAASQRVLLCAHWDTRPWADQEEEYDNRMRPIAGADDGASGVGVLLEIARQLGRRDSLPVGVDLIFFDCEDMGTPVFYTGKQSQDSWCLGSQMWADNYKNFLQVLYAGKTYKYGILLDMVGATDALFPREYYSMQYAQNYVEKVWRTAQRLGYGSMFVDKVCYPITDDHYYVNTVAGIPCIDIIHYDPDSETGFAHYWHTSQDDMRNISRETLKAVGEVVLTTILN